MTEESASSSSSHFYPHGHAKIEEMLQFISRGRKPLANYHLGTMDERAYLHFLEGALTVMNGKTYVPSEPGRPGNSGSNHSFLPTIAGAMTANTVEEVASNLPRNRQQEVLGKLKLIEEKIAAPPNPLAKDMRIPKRIKAPQKKFGAHAQQYQQKNALMGSISHLSKARQIQLLGSLRNLEDRLKLTTAQTMVGIESGFENIESASQTPQPTVEKVMVPGPYGPEMKIRPIKDAGDDLTMTKNKKGQRITYAQVSQTLRRLGKAMTTDNFKVAKYNLNSRENKDIVGHGSIRERVMQLLNIRLSNRDVQILMSRFDREGNETVDLVDVLGNAKLYYSRSVHEENLREEEKLRKANHHKLARATRIARMEEKTHISRMLINKIDELEGLETNLDGIDDETTLDSYSFLQDSYTANDSVSGDISISELVTDLVDIRDFAYNALRSKKMRYLDAVANKITQDQFREILYIFGINSKDTLLILQRRYATSTMGVIDAKSFKRDFKALASHENQKRKQIGAVSSFYKALSTEQQHTTNKQNPYIIQEKGQYGDPHLNFEAMRDRQRAIASLEEQTSEIALKTHDVKEDIKNSVELKSPLNGEQVVNKDAQIQRPTESHAPDDSNTKPGKEIKGEHTETGRQNIDAGDAPVLKKNLTETVLSAEAEHEEEGSYADSYGDDEYEQYEEYEREEI